LVSVSQNEEKLCAASGTLCWKGKLRALYGRRQALVREMARRGYRHRSPLAKSHATGSALQRVFVDTLRE
jgi:Pyrimidine dimer DNA glycosylase